MWQRERIPVPVLKLQESGRSDLPPSLWLDSGEGTGKGTGKGGPMAWSPFCPDPNLLGSLPYSLEICLRNSRIV